MKLLVVADGETELGRQERANDEGTAHLYVRRILELERDDVAFVSFKPTRLPAEPGTRTRGDDAKVVLAYSTARALSCDAAIVFRDAENQPALRRERLEAGRSSAAPTVDLALIIGLQLRAIEAWLLGDPDAFAVVLEAAARSSVSYPVRTEELWGPPQDPLSDHPKNVYRRVLGRDPDAQTNATVIAAQRLEVVRGACPTGFGAFCRELEEAFPVFDIVVAALDRNLGIGRDGDLPWGRVLRGDLAHFKRVTSDAPGGKRNAVVMGRRTWETIPPKQRPLRDRVNIVISRSDIQAGGAIVARSLDAALRTARADPTVHDIFVIGGAQIYAAALKHPRARRLYFTRVRPSWEIDADTFLPAFDDSWEREDVPPEDMEDGGIEYSIERWIRRRPGT